MAPQVIGDRGQLGPAILVLVQSDGIVEEHELERTEVAWVGWLEVAI